MSTRSNIIIHSEIEKKSCVLYHHCDGYPEGVGVHLCELIRSVESLSFDNTRTRIQEDSDYETTSGIHGDIEYLYVVLVDNAKVICFRANNWNGDQFGNGIQAKYLGDMMDQSNLDLILNGGRAMEGSEDIPDLKTFLLSVRDNMEE